MARKPNYDFERRRKELERKNRKEAKREERLRRKAAGLPEEDEGLDGDAGDGTESPDTDSETPDA